MSDAPWLSPAELEAWISLTVLTDVLPAAVDAELREIAGLNFFQYTVLAMLSEQDGHRLQMSDLADVAFGSLSRLSHAVNRLEERGWVERRAGSGGRRHNVVVLTGEGLAALRSAAPAHAAHVRSFLVAPLDDDERQQLSAIARKLIGAIEPELGARLDRMVPEVIERNRSTGG